MCGANYKLNVCFGRTFRKFVDRSFVCRDLASLACMCGVRCVHASAAHASAPPGVVVRVENGAQCRLAATGDELGTLVGCASCHSISRTSSSRALFAVVGVVFRCKHYIHIMGYVVCFRLQ